MLRPGSWIPSCSGCQGSRVGLIDHHSIHSPSWPVRSTAGAERGTCVSFGDIFSSFLWTRETDLVQASRSPLSSWLLLFVWLCWVFIPLCGHSLLGRATLHCSVWASLVMGRTLGHTGSVVVARGHSRSVACGIFTDQEHNLSIHWATRKFPSWLFAPLLFLHLSFRVLLHPAVRRASLPV